MAVASSLPQLILILICCRICWAHFDDLLDRVRLSKSSNPEIRDFLKSVLKHHSDFRWIQDEIDKENEQILSLRGNRYKNKREFYSPANRYPQYRKYGGSKMPASSSAALSLRRFRNNYNDNNKYNIINDNENNAPINDVYPYEEDGVESAASFYKANNQHLKYNDFLENDEADVGYADDEDRKRKKRSLDDELQSNEENKRDIDAERLLNEKLMLRNILSNKRLGSSAKNKNYMKELNEKRTFLDENDDDPRNSIEIMPNSAKGVLYAPGNKYEFKSDDYRKKRDCVENMEDHEIKIDDVLGKKTNESVEQHLGEFYYSAPHDVLGMNQDIELEQHANLNNSCMAAMRMRKRGTRALHLDELLAPSKRLRKQDKALKIKIVDDGKLVKDIQKGETANSIVLTIKNEKTTTKPHYAEPFVDSSAKILNDLNSYSLFSNARDDTLQKIDNIISRDQASLKLNSQIPSTIKHKKESGVLNDLEYNDKALFALYEENAQKLNSTAVKRKSGKAADADLNSIPTNESKNLCTSNQRSQRKPYKISYHRINEIGTRIVDRNPNLRKSDKDAKDASKRMNEVVVEPDALVDGGGVGGVGAVGGGGGGGGGVGPMDGANKPYSLKNVNKIGKDANADQVMQMTTPSQQDEKQNRLEDQTEPTSAAEQRELGKINNRFNTPTMSVSSTERVIVVPLQKKIEIISKPTVGNSDERKLKKSADSQNNIAIDENLRKADDVLDKLRSDLEKSIKTGTVVNNLPSTIQLPTTPEIKSTKSQYDLREKQEAMSKSAIEEVDPTGDVMYNDDYDIDADVFQGRRLQSIGIGKGIDDDAIYKTRKLLNIDEQTTRGLAALLGTTNDEDYAKDRVDFKDLQPLSSHVKRSHNHNKLEIVNDVSELTHPVERKYLMRKGLRKMYRTSAVSQPSHKRDDDLKKRKTAVAAGKWRKQAEGNDLAAEKSHHVKRRMVANDNSCDANPNAFEENHQQQPPNIEGGVGGGGPPSGYGGGGGNELDIIEKTQAILLHVTNPPPQYQQQNFRKNTTQQLKGEYDESDDYNTKQNDGHSQSVQVKRLNAVKVTDQVVNDDLIGDILKLVNLYKQEQHKHEHNNRKSSSNIHHDQDQDQEDGPNRLNKYELNTNDDDYDENNVNVNSFAHHTHKDKKVHPVMANGANKCKIKQGYDHYHPKYVEEIEYIQPKPIREGFFKVDTMTDNKISKDVNNNPVDTQVEDFIFKRGDKVQRKQGDNPMRFTPDNVDSFKEIIENPQENMEVEDKREFTSASKEENEDNINGNERFKRYIDADYMRLYQDKNKRSKRDLDDVVDKEFEDNGDDAELDSLYSPLNQDNEYNDDNNNIRVRRYKNYNYDPYYFESFPRFRQQASASTAATIMSSSDGTMPSSSSSSSNPTTSTITYTSTPLTSDTKQQLINQTTLQPTQNITCPTDDFISFNDVADEAADERQFKQENTKKVLHKGKVPPCGDPFAEFHFSSKEQLEQEKNLRERNREAMKMDKERQRQREKERLKHMLNGRIMVDLMENFNKHLKEHEDLYNKLGQTFSRKCLLDQVARIESYRETQAKQDVKHAQLMLHQIIMMMNKIVTDQVHRKTCLLIAPNLREFLKKITTITRTSIKTNKIAEGYPLPPINEASSVIKSGEKQSDFLFPIERIDDKNSIAIKKKIALIRRLLSKYNHMSENCQIKVEPVRDYLSNHLHMLQRLLKDRDFDICTIRPDFIQCIRGWSSTPSPSNGSSTAGGGNGSAELTTTKSSTTKSGGNEAASSTEAAYSASSSSPSSSLTQTASTASSPAAVSSSAPPDTDKRPSRLNKENNNNNIDIGNNNNNNNNNIVKPYKNYKFHDTNFTPLSASYRKLVDAADNYRRKREIEERLARLYSRHNDKNVDDSVNNIAFEAPLVYSLDD